MFLKKIRALQLQYFFMDAVDIYDKHVFEEK